MRRRREGPASPSSKISCVLPPVGRSACRCNPFSAIQTVKQNNRNNDATNEIDCPKDVEAGAMPSPIVGGRKFPDDADEQLLTRSYNSLGRIKKGGPRRK